MANNNNLSDLLNISNEDVANINHAPLTQAEMDAMDEKLIEQAEISDFTYKHFSGLPQF